MNKEAVEHKAYELWEADGRPHGRDREHWHKAEALVSERPSTTSKSKTKVAANGRSRDVVSGARSMKTKPAAKATSAKKSNETTSVKS